MTQESKKLLLVDLSARVPYGVKVKVPCLQEDIDFTLNSVDKEGFTVIKKANGSKFEFEVSNNIEIFPYLRPISSMTEEEKKEYCNLQDKLLYSSQYPVTDAYELFDWLNEHHFDYRNLVERGLAIAVTEENNPYKE